MSLQQRWLRATAPRVVPLQNSSRRRGSALPRRVMGLLLIAASVWAGIAIVKGADHREPFVVLAHDISAGVELAADDLTTVSMNLGSSDARYARSISSAVGVRTARDMVRGELVPVSFRDRSPVEHVITVPIRGERLPDLARGDRVDIWATREGASPALVATRIPVVAVRAAGGSVQALSLSLAEGAVPVVIDAAENALMSVVRR